MQQYIYIYITRDTLLPGGDTVGGRYLGCFPNFRRYCFCSICCRQAFPVICLRICRKIIMCK